MVDKFLKIAITAPEDYPGEEKIINTLLSKDIVDFVHIRKPGKSIYQIENLIKKITPNFYYKLKLHDHFDLLNHFDLGGIHLNSRNPVPHHLAKSVSISFHGLDQIKKSEQFDYFFISPVFDSISKGGYHSTFDLDKLSSVIKNRKAIALGGVTPAKYTLLKSIGFYGAALLGFFFPPLSDLNN